MRIWVLARIFRPYEDFLNLIAIYDHKPTIEELVFLGLDEINLKKLNEFGETTYLDNSHNEYIKLTTTVLNEPF